jgi:hypothetical protein
MTGKEMAIRLRESADLFERLPDSIDVGTYSGETIRVKTKHDFLAAMRALPGLWNKCAGGNIIWVYRHLPKGGYIDITVDRDQVCEKVVTTKTVPATPEVVIPAEPEKVVEVIEWRCPESLLGEREAEATNDA